VVSRGRRQPPCRPAVGRWPLGDATPAGTACSAAAAPTYRGRRPQVLGLLQVLPRLGPPSGAARCCLPAGGPTRPARASTLSRLDALPKARSPEPAACRHSPDPCAPRPCRCSTAWPTCLTTRATTTTTTDARERGRWTCLRAAGALVQEAWCCR
jgi:hypothetical protein